MAADWRKVLAAFALWTVAATSEAAADQILVSSVTCINPNSSAGCASLSSGQQVWWRVLNWMNMFDISFPGSNDLRDVTLEFTYQDGSSTTHWDVILPAATGVYGETDPFDASLLKQSYSLRLTAMLVRTDFDPLYSSNPYLEFIADGPVVTGKSTDVPGMDVFAQGQFVMNPTPEPATLTFVGLGLGGLFAGFRARVKQ